MHDVYEPCCLLGARDCKAAELQGQASTYNDMGPCIAMLLILINGWSCSLWCAESVKLLPAQCMYPKAGPDKALGPNKPALKTSADLGLLVQVMTTQLCPRGAG